MSAAAHRRPGVIALWFGYRALAALIVAAPTAATVGALIAGYPRGDAELFDPGGVMLLEAARLARRAVPAVLAAGGSAALIAAVLGLLPFAAVIAALGTPGRVDLRSLAARAFEHVGTLALLWGAAAAAAAVAALLVVLLGAKLTGALHLGTRAEDLADLAVLAVALLAVFAVGVIRDLASVAAVHGGHRFYVASSRALQTAARAPARVFWAWAWRAALGLGALVAAAALAPRSATALVLAAVIHQAGLAASLIARASWLAAAIRILDRGARIEPRSALISEPPPPRSEPPPTSEPPRSEPSPASEPPRSAPEPAPITPPRSDS